MTPRELHERLTRAQRAAKAAGLDLVPLPGGRWCLAHKSRPVQRLEFPSLTEAHHAAQVHAEARAEMRAAAVVLRAQVTAKKAVHP